VNEIGFRADRSKGKLEWKVELPGQPSGRGNGFDSPLLAALRAADEVCWAISHHFAGNF